MNKMIRRLSALLLTALLLSGLAALAADGTPVDETTVGGPLTLWVTDLDVEESALLQTQYLYLLMDRNAQVGSGSVKIVLADGVNNAIEGELTVGDRAAGEDGQYGMSTGSAELDVASALNPFSSILLCADGAFMTYVDEEDGYLLLKVPVIIEPDVIGDYTVTFTVKLTDSAHGDGYALTEGTVTSTVSIKAHVHTPGEPVVENEVPATCTAEGSYDEVTYCTACGAELTRETKTIDKLAHTPGEPVIENEVPATCTVDGSHDEVTYCTACGAELSRETVAIPALGHDWGEWIVTTEPTEDEEGVEKRTCARCGAEETRPVPPLSHVHAPTAHDRLEPTCTEDGYEAYWSCAGCGRLFSDAEATAEIPAPVAIPALGHDWGEWIVTKEPTEDEEGVEKRTCARCGAEETRPVPPLSHVHAPTAHDRLEPTCTEDGYEAYWSCTGCGRLFSDAAATAEIPAPVAIPALGHDWGEWITVRKATTALEGEESRTCARCGATESRWTPKLAPTGTPAGTGRVVVGYRPTAPAHACPSAPYQDIDITLWYHLDLDYVIGRELMVGVTDDTFIPDGPTSRAMAVTVLWRQEGRPDAAKASPFVDLEPGSWYETAVNWAWEKGIAIGVDATHFAPTQQMTREQMAAFLHRYAAFKGLDASARKELTDFVDASDVSGWALPSVRWAVARGIVNGVGEGRLAPLGVTSRAQYAAMLHRYLTTY